MTLEFCTSTLCLPGVTQRLSQSGVIWPHRRRSDSVERNSAPKQGLSGMAQDRYKMVLNAKQIEMSPQKETSAAQPFASCGTLCRLGPLYPSICEARITEAAVFEN